MNHKTELLLLGALGILIVLFISLYRSRFTGRSKSGLHLQALGIAFAWIGGVLAFVLDLVELGAKAVIAGILIGLVGLFVQTRCRNDESK